MPYSDRRQKWRRAVAQANLENWIHGRLGRNNGDGTYTFKVPDRPSFVYVQMASESGSRTLGVARNVHGIPLRANLPVRMLDENGVLVIEGIDSADAGSIEGSDPTGPPAGGVEVHHHRIGSGLEYLYDARLWEAGRVAGSNSLVVHLSAFRYQKAVGTWDYWPGGYIDLATHVPGTAGEHRWVMVGLDPATNTVVAVAGTPKADTSPLTIPELDDINFLHYIPCGAVRLHASDTDLTDPARMVDAHGWFNIGSLQHVVEDTTPQLGGDLDGQSLYDLQNIVNAEFEGYVDFIEIPEPANPGVGTLRLWAETQGGFGQLHFRNSNGLDYQLGRDNIHTVRNESGATLTKGAVVYITGSTGVFPTVALARADSPATTPAAGLMVSDAPDNDFGQMMTMGDEQGIDTSAFLEGDVLYLSAVTAGGMTATPPSGTSVVQRLGVVITSSAGAGVIAILIGGEFDPTLTTTFQNKTINSANNTIVMPLGDLSDVDMTGLADDDILRYNLGAGAFQPVSMPTGVVAGDAASQTISTGSVSGASSNILLLPESGTADDLDTITGGVDGKIIVLRIADAGDVITVKHFDGNIWLFGANNDRVLSDIHDSLWLMWSAANARWEEVSPKTLDQLNKVIISGPVDGEFLGYDSAFDDWKNLPILVNTLQDVNAPTPADQDVLAWDLATEKWIPVPPGTPTIPDPLPIGEVRAKDVNGLRLADDASTLGIFIADGGNVGFQTTDIEAWDSNWGAIEFGPYASMMYFAAAGNPHVYLMSNVYYDGVWKYKTSAEGAAYNLSSGTHRFRVAPSGTIDTALTWTEALWIANDGNVGIGTTNPLAALQVGDDSAAKDAWIYVGAAGNNTEGVAFRRAGSTDGSIFVNTTEDLIIQYQESDLATRSLRIRRGSAGADVMVFDDQGQVAIGGTTSWAAKIHLEGEIGIRSGMAAFHTGRSDPSIYSTDDTFEGVSGLYGSLVLQSRSSFGRPIMFATGATPTERMRITGSGDVGIGTTSPVRPLHLVAPNNAWFEIWGANGAQAGILLGDAASGWQGRVHYDNGTNNLEFYANRSNLLTINSNGDVYTATNTWNPTIQGSTGNPSVSYTTRVGRYVKIGKWVWCTFNIKINTISGGSGTARITLPFTVSNLTSENYLGSLYSNAGASVSPFTGAIHAAPNANYALLIAYDGVVFNISHLADGEMVQGTIFFRTG